MFEQLNAWARTSVTLKLLVIGILILVLLIPSAFLSSLIEERERLRDQAINEVSSKWGGPQTIGGPVISIPYQVQVKGNNGETIIQTQYAHFLPDQLRIKGTMVPEKRKRGIYVVVLYHTLLEVEGSFSPLNFEALPVKKASLDLSNAFFTLGISDMKGIKESIPVALGDTTYQFSPGIPTSDIFGVGVSFPLKTLDTEGMTFRFQLSLNGSTRLHFLPFGVETQVALQSPWADPSFEGAFLPEERQVGSDGFTANWRVLQLNRNYPQQGTGAFIGYNKPNAFNQSYYYTDFAPDDPSGAFGVRLLLPVDEYMKTKRSEKYAIILIAITFMAFFFVEVLNQKRFHPIQYVLIGFAIIIFYLLLLAFSEHIFFDAAYLVCVVIVLLLITFYCFYLFRNKRLTWLLSGMLLLAYGFFYSLLQLQDYALLMGSLGLFLILGTVMYLTRHIDWYDVNLRNRP
jgi:inner membrane protein